MKGRGAVGDTRHAQNQMSSESSTTPTRLMSCVHSNVQPREAQCRLRLLSRKGKGGKTAGRGAKATDDVGWKCFFSALTARSEGRRGEVPQVTGDGDGRCPLLAPR